MGNLCGESAYNQLKSLHPQELTDFITANTIQNQIGSYVSSAQTHLNSGIQTIQKDNLATIDGKKNEITNHFNQAKDKVDKSYPGGVRFLQASRGAKIEDILGYTAVQKKFADVKDYTNKQFSQQKEAATNQLNAVTNQQVGKLQSSGGRIQEFLSQKGEQEKAQALSKGLEDNKAQIEASTNGFFQGFSQKLGIQQLLNKFKTILPLDQLQNLTQFSKDNISSNVASLIGRPGDGKATLF